MPNPSSLPIITEDLSTNTTLSTEESFNATLQELEFILCCYLPVLSSTQLKEISDAIINHLQKMEKSH
jgi:hypothetical protein